MVVKIISLPGVMPPEMVEKFQKALEQALRKALAEQVKERLDLQKKLNKAWKTIEGYKIEEMRPKTETKGRSPSAIEWLASLFVILIIGLAIYGAKRNAG
jgi:cobaltochelatase CobN